jgi:polysaccharide pyruvyl transferase WcaK-like protein
MNQRVIGVFGTQGGVCFSTTGFEQALDEIGNNTGNALFQRAVWDRVNLPKVTVKLENWQQFKGQIDALVIPAANQVNPDWDLGDWADMVEELNVPVCIVGLGAQAHIGATTNLPLSEGTLRFLRAVAQRTENIGVRGEFTRQVLSSAGIHNTVVTGCPSNFLNRKISGATVQAALDRARSRENIRMGYVFGTMEEVTRPIERTLFALARKHIAPIIYQTNEAILRFLHDGVVLEKSVYDMTWEAQELSHGAWDLAEYLRIVHARGVFYSDARTWIDRMHVLDIVIGMRIHGAVAAIQAGTLGLCVPFDSRTLELVETMKYPTIGMCDITSEDSLEAILEKVCFDPEEFDDARTSLGSAIDKIFEVADIV